MNIMKIFIKGLLSGLKTAGFLLLIMIPVYIITVLLKHSPIFPTLEHSLEPVMKIFNTPGSSGIPIISAALGDEYSFIASLKTFNFNTAVTTTLAMMILYFHSIPTEIAVAKSVGFSPVKLLILRVVLAVVVGILVGQIGGLIL